MGSSLSTEKCYGIFAPSAAMYYYGAKAYSNVLFGVHPEHWYLVLRDESGVLYKLEFSDHGVTICVGEPDDMEMTSSATGTQRVRTGRDIASYLNTNWANQAYSMRSRNCQRFCNDVSDWWVAGT